MFETCITRFAEKHPSFGFWLVIAAVVIGGVIDNGAI